MAGASAGVIATGLPDASGIGEFVRVIELMHAEIEALKAKNLQRDPKPRDLTEQKLFSNLPHFDGAEKDFSDWEFKVQQFVRPYKHFEEFLDWIKESKNEVSRTDLFHRQRHTQMQSPEVNLTGTTSNSRRCLGKHGQRAADSQEPGRNLHRARMYKSIRPHSRGCG